MPAVAGLNAPADARLAPNFFALLGANYIRVVLIPGVDLNEWIDDAHARGMSVLGVIANESLHNGDINMSSVEAAQFYHDRYGDSLEALQIGNEWDHVSPASWTMSPQVLNHFLMVFSIAFPDTPIVLGGCADGRPEAVADIDDQLYDILAVHPYGRRPNSTEDWSMLPGNFGEVNELLDGYATYGKPLWITEIGVESAATSELFQAKYCLSMMQTMMAREDTDVVCWFCADDAMVPTFGLYDDQSNAKPAAVSFVKAAGAMPQKPEPGVPMALPIPVFKTMWQAHLPSAEFNPSFGVEKFWMTNYQKLGAVTSLAEYREGKNAYRTFVGGVIQWTDGVGAKIA